MDPDATLKELRGCIDEFWRVYEAGDIIGIVDAGAAVTTVADALDRWMSDGGYKPEGWGADS